MARARGPGPRRAQRDRSRGSQLSAADPGGVAKLTATSREAQGFPALVTDVDALRAVAVVIARNVTSEVRSKRAL